MIGEIFLRDLVHLDTDFFSSIYFELIFTKCRIFLEAIVHPFITSLDASLSQIMGNMMVSLFFSLPKSMAIRLSLLNDMILNREKVQCTVNCASTAFTFFQEMPASAIFDAFTPVQKGILCIAFQDLSRTTQIALHCPCPQSSSLNFSPNFVVGIILL